MTGSRKKQMATAALVVGLALLLSGCAHTHLPQDSLNNQGPYAAKENHLFWPVFWIAVAVFVLVQGLLITAIFKFRHKPGNPMPKQIHGNKRMELGWTIAPALLLAGIAVPTVTTIFALAQRPAGQVLDVSVTGHQWWWEVNYPGTGVVTANEIHIPTNEPVSINITSVDVIHSFWVPELAGKQDLEPGRLNHVLIEATHPGVYLGQCAEYCGTSHANMRFRVMAQTPADYQTWLKGQQQGPATAGGLAAQGADVFVHGSWPLGACVGCHTIHGVSEGKIGPNLTHFGSRTTFAGAILRNTPANIAAWLRDPSAVKPGVDMPNLGLSPTEVRELVAYLESLQ
ncbi:MAG TPA: cytochrome c oxidase subunit II [Actinobacteria bacterium]|nr:cytochrome c oxidase subunit II [Actinomycetota bacterium]